MFNFEELRKPFGVEDIEWRIQQSGEKNGKPWGMCLAYVTNRAIMSRLDDVCGPQNWKNEFSKAPDGGVLCKISIKCGDEWVSKEDGAENTDIERVKGGLSGSMKRAAVQWGIGRYLYKLDTGWANFTDKGGYTAKIKTKSGDKFFKWNPPSLPKWALPVGVKRQSPQKTVSDNTNENKKTPLETLEERLAGITDIQTLEQWENDTWNTVMGCMANKQEIKRAKDMLVARKQELAGI